MTGITNGLRWARSGDVRVTLYGGSDGGSVQILRNGEWGIARSGEVVYPLVIELVQDAMRAKAADEDEFLATLTTDPNC